MRHASFSWSYTTNHVGSVFDHLSGMECTLFTRKTLDNNV